MKKGDIICSVWTLGGDVDVNSSRDDQLEFRNQANLRLAILAQTPFSKEVSLSCAYLTPCQHIAVGGASYGFVGV